MMVRLATPLVGTSLDRVDGPQKVGGRACYPSDVVLPRMVHAALVQATIGAGRIVSIDPFAALAAPGVIDIITHENTPRLEVPPQFGFSPNPQYPLRDDRVYHHGQHVAVVVAETRSQATAAARLVAIEYEPTAVRVDMDGRDAVIRPNQFGLDYTRGDVKGALRTSDVRYDEHFIIPPETNSPLGLFATIADWEGDRLTVHDATQWPAMVCKTLAAAFGIPNANVRVLVPFLGGGFGAGLRSWTHATLAAVAARVVQRPVKIVLTRPQMFNSAGHRPATRQRLRIGATRDGQLTAIEHSVDIARGITDWTLEPVTFGVRSAYACPNVATHDRTVALNIPGPCAMRGPGSVQAHFAIESALDELSYELGLDPIDLRRRNYAVLNPQSNLPWSSKALEECYRVGAERFGWSNRDRRAGAMRDGHSLIGYGMAGVTYEWYTQPCQARVTLRRDGHAYVESSGTDIGTGTYTVMTQLAADLLGLSAEQVHVVLGDTDLPEAPQSGGSGLAIALTGAVQSAVENLYAELARVLADDRTSPLHGRTPDELRATNGRLHLANDPQVGEAYTAILAHHDLQQIVGEGKVDQYNNQSKTMSPSPAFAAHFVELRVDVDLGVPRLTRIVTVVDAGRVLNPKLARSQIIGGVAMGVGMTLFEETVFDRTGRVANGTLADYLIPVNADIPDIEVEFVGQPDRFNAGGLKGIGEIGTVGIAPAIANAAYHATGKRIHSLPITVEKLLAATGSPR